MSPTKTLTLNTRAGDQVRDDTGIEYTLGQVIGRPGLQGVVHRVVGQPDLAVKLLKSSDDASRIKSVRRLPLDGMQLAAPLSIICEGGSGYVMRLASDMTPLAEPYLPREFASRQNGVWFRETGGLRRRLAIAANIAQCLAGLHERGLVYVDLNPNNVMVSNDLSRTETWLIDTDNLTSRSRPEFTLLGFPKYIAPERSLMKSPPSTFADTYALAIVIFRLLVLCHPLEGIAAEELDGQDARVAFDTGALPYVADPHDGANCLVPDSLHEFLFDVNLDDSMKQLFLRTFGEGRHSPHLRPSAAKWREALWSAHDNIIDCAHRCGWSYFGDLDRCPACNSPTPPNIICSIAAEEDSNESTSDKRHIRTTFRLSKERSFAVEGRHLWGTYASLDPFLTFRPIAHGFELDTHGAAHVVDVTGDRVRQIGYPQSTQQLSLRIEVPGRPRRFLLLSSVDER